MADRIIAVPFTQPLSLPPDCLILFVSRLCQHFLCFNHYSASSFSRVQVGFAKFHFWSLLCGYSDNSETVTFSALVSYYPSQCLQSCRITQVISFTKATFCYLFFPGLESIKMSLKYRTKEVSLDDSEEMLLRVHRDRERG